MTRDKRIDLRANREELALLRQRASQAGMTLGRYLREMRKSRNPSPSKPRNSLPACPVRYVRPGRASPAIWTGMRTMRKKGGGKAKGLK